MLTAAKKTLLRDMGNKLQHTMAVISAPTVVGVGLTSTCQQIIAAGRFPEIH